MALAPSQQILEAVKRSNHPLICVPSGAGVDQYASAIGLANVFNKMEKQVAIVAADSIVPKTLGFLNNEHKIKHSLDHLQQFMIELDASKTKIDELTYERKGETLIVYLSPKEGMWKQTDVRTSTSGYRYDLIITIGAPDYESFGELYTKHSDFFYRTPVINIDHSPENEQYGQMNKVDMTASACAEVCHDLIESIDPTLIEANTATALLTGMIAKTRSFKSKHITPKTLQTASKLMAKGADRERIVQNLYRTRSLATLRLWGRALARLKTDERARMIWTLLSAQDFMHAQAEEPDLPDVIDELLSSSPNARVTILIYEDEKHQVKAIVRTESPIDAVALCAPFHAAGTREEVRLSFPNKSLGQVEMVLIEHIKKTLP